MPPSPSNALPSTDASRALDVGTVRAALCSPTRLAALQAIGLMDSETEAVFDELAALAAHCAEAPRAAVAFVGAERQFFKSAVGFPPGVASGRSAPISHSLCRFVVARGASFAVGDARTHPLTHDDGAVRDYGVVAFAGAPIHSAEGEVVGAVCVYDTRARDWSRDALRALESVAHAVATEIALRGRVADLERAEREREAGDAALRASERLFRTFVEQSAEAVFVLDPRGRFAYVSPSTERLLGHAVERLVAGDAFAYVHPDDVGRCGATLADLFASPGTVRTNSVRVRHADGGYRVVDMSGRAMQGDAAGMDGVLVCMRDVTERRQVKAALTESEERLREALGAANMLAWELDVTTGRVRSTAATTAGWVSMENATSGTAHGTLDAFLSIVHPDDRARMAAAIQAAADGGRPLDEEYRVHGSDGGARWRHTKGRATPGPDGGASRLVGVTLDVSQRKALEAELTQRTLHDALTGLANRVHLRQRVEAALARAASGDAVASPPAVLFLDLDDFKTVNDSLGHDAGDALLVHVAARLLQATRSGDTVARLGGDEFAILLERTRTPEDAALVAGRVVDALGTPFLVDGRTLRIGGSVGIAHARPGDRADDLLRNADVAMYHAKGGGKSQWAAFTPAMHEAALERLESEIELRRAVERDELTLHYQPVVDVVTGAVVGAEALGRWRHPERGVISIGPYMPLIEATELIVPVGRLGLHEACREAATWTAPPGTAAPTVAVNVSGRQLMRPGFVEDVAAALRESGLDPHRLTLEVTESVLLADLDAAIGRLESLRGLGLRLALDDFGTGYSSLAYLHRLPVDVLKIDRSFIADIAAGGRRTALASAILTVAAALGLQTVAEGVETPEQLAALQALGCPLAQGFLYAPALAPAAFEAFRRDRQAPPSESRRSTDTVSLESRRRVRAA